MTLWHTIKDNQQRQLKRLPENTAWKVATFQVNHRTLETDTWPLSLQTRLEIMNI
jgi:cation transport regulator ChaB